LEAIDGFFKFFAQMILITIVSVVVYKGCTHPENKSALTGETTEFKFTLSSSDIKDFKANPGNVMSYTTYEPVPKPGLWDKIMKNDEELKKLKEESMLQDVSENKHDSAVSMTVDPEGEREPYIILTLEDVRGKLESYDTFEGVLSIVPEQDFYDTPFKSIKTKMNFYFINEKEKILGQYTIDSNKTLPIKVNIKNSKQLYIVAKTDYKELFIGAILSPRLIKN
jgi:hypothetical protein